MSDVTIADVMSEYARDAVKHARKFDRKLDYSEQSLLAVDEILWDIAGNGVIEITGPSHEEALWLLSLMYGGYVGEVVIRCMGGSWKLEKLGEGVGRAVLVVDGVTCVPPEKVFKRLTQDVFDAVSDYCRFLRFIIAECDKKRFASAGGACSSGSDSGDTPNQMSTA